MSAYLLKLQSELPPAVSENLPWILVVAVAALVLAVFLIVRNLNDSRRAVFAKRWQTDDPDDGTALVTALAANQKPRDWAGRMDRKFETMVQRTGLRLDSQQALGTITLAGTVVAAGLMIWRGDLWSLGGGLVAGSAL